MADVFEIRQIDKGLAYMRVDKVVGRRAAKAIMRLLADDTSDDPSAEKARQE